MSNKITKATRDRLRRQFESACNAYLKTFCEKHDYDYEEARRSWAAGDVGGIVDISEFYLSMTDIRTDIDMDAPDREFVRWYDYCLRLHTIDSTIPTPNYENWLRGCPRKSEDEIQNLELLHHKVEMAKAELVNAIEHDKGEF